MESRSGLCGILPMASMSTIETSEGEKETMRNGDEHPMFMMRCRAFRMAYLHKDTLKTLKLQW